MLKTILTCFCLAIRQPADNRGIAVNDLRKLFSKSKFATVGYGLGTGADATTVSAKEAVNSPLLRLSGCAFARIHCHDPALVLLVGKGVSDCSAHQATSAITEELRYAPRFLTGLSRCAMNEDRVTTVMVMPWE